MDEQTVVNVLVEIAELEDLRTQARQTLQDIAAKTKQLSELQAEYESDAQLAGDQSRETGRDFRARDRELREVETRLADRRRRLAVITEARQHRALTDEIASLEAQLDRLETEALACLEREEDQTRIAGEAGRESNDRGRRTAEELAAMAAQARELEARVENIRLDLHRLRGMLPDTERRHVERLDKGLDQSVVFHHNGACCGCFHQLPVQEALNVDRGRTILRCPSCMRYIVHRPWK